MVVDVLVESPGVVAVAAQRLCWVLVETSINKICAGRPTGWIAVVTQILKISNSNTNAKKKMSMAEVGFFVVSFRAR
jgi:hypothetical protein